MAALAFVFIFSSAGLLWNFYKDHTIAFAAEGGTFIEGDVRTIDQGFVLNPLLVTANSKAGSVEASISRVIFAGLMKFEAKTGEIIDHLASHTLSEDKKKYVFTLKEGVKWHDSIPITADDVIFTYQTLIQNPLFPNSSLRDTFIGIVIEKVDDRTISFTLPKPYKFFLTNFTIGLVPKHILELTPPENIALDDFNLNPIGAGPYRFSKISYSDDKESAVIDLEAFPEYIGGKPKISFLQFKLYPNNEILAKNTSGLNALYPKIKNEYDFLSQNDGYTLRDFTLPQYVAVFINMDSPKLAGTGNQSVRLALQLATNKEEILTKVSGKRIDTPLLETDTSEWLFEYDPVKAAGALKDSGWFLLASTPPEPVPAKAEETPPQEPPPQGETPKKLRFIYHPGDTPEVQTSLTDDYLLGTFPASTIRVSVNGYFLQLFDSSSERFSYRISSDIGTLKKGENVYHVEFFGKDGKIDEEDIRVYFGEKIPEVTKKDAKDNDGIPPSPEGTPPKESEVPSVQIPDNIRRDKEGKPLVFDLVTVDTPSFYPIIAENLKKEWADVGIELNVEVLTQENFAERALVRKDYDLLLYGENMGYNLDAFPFWHYSQGDTGSNLSKYKSFEAGVLLEEIRQSHDGELRLDRLKKLRDLIKTDVPAVFLLSPYYTMPIDPKIQNVDIKGMALVPDRFSDIEQWYIREARSFRPGSGWLDFFPWFFSQIFGN